MAAPSAFDPTTTFVDLAGDGSAKEVPGGPSFWPDLMSGKLSLDGPWLVTMSTPTADWGQWEMHPNGEELLVLLEGSLEMVLDNADGEARVALTPGKAFLMPRGVWHRAVVHAPSRMLGITAGAGTEHRAYPG